MIKINLKYVKNKEKLTMLISSHKKRDVRKNELPNSPENNKKNEINKN